METPNVPQALAIARKHGWQFDIMSTSFFLSRRALKPAAHSGHAALAGSAVHRAGRVRERRDRLLPYSDRAGGRGRHPGDDLGSDSRRMKPCRRLWTAVTCIFPACAIGTPWSPMDAISAAPRHIAAQHSVLGRMHDKQSMPRPTGSRLATASAARSPHRFWALTLGSIGVVYGDIGTSPLYAFREAVAAGAAPRAATREAVLGVLSLILWALILDRHAQIRPDPAARRQQRRRRHPVADGAGAAGARHGAPSRGARSASSAPRCSTATR